MIVHQFDLVVTCLCISSTYDGDGISRKEGREEGKENGEERRRETGISTRNKTGQYNRTKD